jgi:DNA-binding transcriptional LysR family regulator
MDLDALRALALADKLGGFGSAAAKLGRTPSAVSLQMKKLQASIGVPLFRKQGRAVALTEAGELTLQFAQRLLALNDEMLDTVRGAAATGSVRIGVSQDFAEIVLPQVLAQFVKLYPLVLVEVRIEGNAALVAALERGELDLALVVGHAKRGASTLGEIDLVWIADPRFRDHADRPLSLVMFGPQCAFRQEALKKLDESGRGWRIAAVSPSLAGLWAAASAGLGITARSRLGIPSHLASGERLFDLPRLDAFPVTLHTRSKLRNECAVRLRDMMSDAAVAAIGR